MIITTTTTIIIIQCSNQYNFSMSKFKNNIESYNELDCEQGKDIVVFRFIIEYSSLMDFGPQVIIIIIIGLIFLYEDF